MQRDRVTGERRPVTALLIDVVGSTSLAEGIDPEDWATTMERAMAIMTGVVERYDGLVASNTGGGLMALFESSGATAHVQRVRELQASLQPPAGG